ncbi:MAG: phosphoribosylanthranilate isomerase [Planctomycetota bacterium]|nr:phosphoribosylanthranilate isomerase [Planctomycetaceae bacterium]MDQ3330692.1 phosphoribosylanthranilate isomerase [Planctomycetota bacterium]
MTSVSDSRFVFVKRHEAPWVKLCGVRDVATARSLATLKPDAIGLNFYSPSVRFVATPTAAEICRSLPTGIMPVGVFVNAPLDEIVGVAADTGIAAVQLHGDEPPSLIAELRAARPSLPVLKAWRVDAEDLSSLATFLQECARLGAAPDAILIDAKVAGAYGGTGKTAPWELLRNYDESWPPLILAGGLVPENVADAISITHPFGVDTAGGIESSAGVKDVQRAAAFIAAARALAPRASH